MVLLNVRQVAALFGEHENTIRAWCDQGRLPCTGQVGEPREFDAGVVGSLLRRRALAADQAILLKRAVRVAGPHAEHAAQAEVVASEAIRTYTGYGLGYAMGVTDTLLWLAGRGPEPEMEVPR